MDKVENRDGWHISRYDAEYCSEWDRFVADSVNGTFLFFRGYMDYHADRFQDCSLMAYKDGRLKGLLPADITDDRTLHSHRGLTYGGWVLPVTHFDANDMMEMWDKWLEWCRQNGIRAIDYKPVPWIYAVNPAQEDLYALFRHKAILTECNLSSTISLQSPRPFNTQQRRNLKKGDKEEGGIEELDTKAFYGLLAECLNERHGVKPVHSMSELALLQQRFPEHIRLFGFRNAEGVQAGVCMYLSKTTAHCQYIASTPYARGKGLLTRLFAFLIDKYQSEGYRYFDFGISNEEHGMVLNHGLLRQKASLGGSGVAYMRYAIEVY